MRLIPSYAFVASGSCRFFPFFGVRLVYPFHVAVRIGADYIACYAVRTWFFAIAPTPSLGIAKALAGDALWNRFWDLYALCITFESVFLAITTSVLEGRFANALLMILSTALASLVLRQSFF